VTSGFGGAVWSGTAFPISLPEKRWERMLTVYGATVVTLMMIFYALEARSVWFTLAFAVACFGSASYGFLAGTWPFGVVESVWGVIAWRKWSILRKNVSHSPNDGRPG